MTRETEEEGGARRPILIADDHPLFANALAMAVRQARPLAGIDAAPTMAAAERLASSSRHALILLDLMLPDVHGFGGLALLRSLQPSTPMAIVTSRDEAGVARQAASLGATGFISKGAHLGDMVAAITALLSGRSWFPEGVTAHEPSASDTHLARFSELSTAQLKVLRRMADGLQNKHIAYELGIAETTVKSHLVAVFRKLGVTNRTQALLALRTVEGSG